MTAIFIDEVLSHQQKLLKLARVIASRKVSRVRILLDYRPALRHRTGVGEYAHELVRALIFTRPESGEELTLFSASWKDRLAADAAPGATVLDRRIPNRALNFSWHRLGWPAVERIAGKAFDVVQTFHPLLMPSRSAARIVTVHDLDFLDHPERTEREIRRDYPGLAKAHAQRADHVIVNSETTARDVRERLGVPSARITVCTPGAPAWPAREQEPAANPCVLFIGSIEPRKNLGILLDAYERVLARHPDTPPLVLAGRMTPAGQMISRRVAERPLAGHVEMPGYVSERDRFALFQRALVLVLPSHNEGFGMPALEAMTAGVPVIAADRGALPEVTAGAARLFEPDDESQLTMMLEEVLADASARQAMREAGWTRARNYTWRDSAVRLREAWKLAVEHRRHRRG